ncbi:Fatty acyl-CoA reductase 2 [Platanthera guangdongensis]|uniref:Fatty acyl-CoA reductase n=1 Tax=Platanthera guangdongensis TaxID=2320717 RepID=A0ABR2M586_9ASPA
MTLSSYLNPITSFIEKPTNSSFNKLHHHHYDCSGLMMMPARINNKITAYCHSRGKLSRPNGYSPTSMRRSSAASKKNMMFPKNTNEIAVLGLVQCNNTAGRGNAMRGFEAGIGITRFLKGKSFFITGATGFLAKVFIEKILRTAPSVDKIYVLIKAKNKEAAFDRLKNEIINIELFSSLQEIHGSDFQDFMLKKLIPVTGNVTKAKMGIDAAMAEEISQEVDIIVNSAANTTFDESMNKLKQVKKNRYDVALDTNTIGAFRLMSFAKRFKRLKVFLQVSTAYVNGKREGRVLEKPFCIGDSIVKEIASPEYEGESMPLLNIEAEIRLALNSRKASDDVSLVQKMKDLGLKRANIYGWQDTYVFTKAMAEMGVNNMKGDIPVVTIRPSVIESTWKEPFPGWMEGNRMMDPVVLYYGKGQLTGFLADPKGVLDVVPADMVVNAMLAAMAKHGWTKQPGNHTYHIASSIVNPLVFEKLSSLTYRHFKSIPCIDSKGRPIEVPQMKLFDDINEFSDHIHSNAIQRMSLHEKMSQKLSNVILKLVDQAKYLANIYEPYTFYRGRFDNTNTQKLIDEMSEEERGEFGFDVGEVDWEDYIPNVHIPGLRRHVMKGRGMCANNSQLVGAQV